MRKLTSLVIAAAVATSVFVIPTMTFGMECRALCSYYPKRSLLSESRDEVGECQRRINDSGGFCTIHGRLNLGKDLPRGINYRRQDYTDPRKYDWDVMGIPWWR